MVALLEYRGAAIFIYCIDVYYNYCLWELKQYCKLLKNSQRFRVDSWKYLKYNRRINVVVLQVRLLEGDRSKNESGKSE